jgi:LacI family transcriptional regulator
MITIREIASHMGVCPMTVSNALNDRKGVSKEKAEKIKKYAKKMGWSGSYMAAALSSGKTRTIGLLLRLGVYNSFYAKLLDGLCRGFYEKGYHVLPVIADRDYEEQEEALQWLAKFKVEALIIGPFGFVQDYQALSKALQPFNNILAVDATENLPCDHIGVDAYNGALMLMEHLKSNGHQRVGYIGAVQHDIDRPWVKTRYTGFIEAAKAQGIQIHPEWIFRAHPNEDPFNQENFDSAIATVLTSQNRPTALVCHNDEYAMRGMLLAKELGLSVPEDISFVSFDNIPFSRFISPPLTTIGFNLEKYVELIVEHCLQRIETPAQAGEIFRKMLDPILHQRASVADIS